MMIVLTPIHIEELKTPMGGYNKETMEMLGVWPLSAGWQQRLVGTRVSEKTWRKLMGAKTRRLHHYGGNTRRA